MIKKQTFDKYFSKIITGTSKEALEMKEIAMRMIKSEITWAKAHQNEKVCSKCGRLNSQA